MQINTNFIQISQIVYQPQYSHLSNIGDTSLYYNVLHTNECQLFSVQKLIHVTKMGQELGKVACELLLYFNNHY